MTDKPNATDVAEAMMSHARHIQEAAAHTAKHGDTPQAIQLANELTDVLNACIKTRELNNGEYTMALARFVGSVLIDHADSNHEADGLPIGFEDHMHQTVFYTLVQVIVAGHRAANTPSEEADAAAAAE